MDPICSKVMAVEARHMTSGPLSYASDGMSWPRRFVLVVALLVGGVPYAHSGSILKRQVTVHAVNVRLSTVLHQIARDASFKLSYNAAVVPSDSVVTVNVDGQKVEEVLKQMLPRRLLWKESGNHLIITGSAGRKQKFSASGSVVDAGTGSPIARASVFEVRRSNASVSNESGMFTVDLTGELDRTPLLVSRHGYRDTVVFVGRDGQVGRVQLKALDQLERIEPICEFERCGVEDLGVARLLVPTSRMDQASNLEFAERRNWQLSLVPTVSTNGPIGGAVINRVSLNIIGGYARGVEGVEVGGAVNVLSADMKGLQVGGLGNLVGGRSRGVQIAGGLNHTMRSLEGLQLAGLANTVWDTLGGVQVAGGVNVVKRGMAGTQVSGAANITLGDLDGVQVSGGVNVTHGAVNTAQVAGAVNYARRVKGGQVAAGVNVSLGEVGGGQVGFGGNYARSVSGGQVSFGLNFVLDTVSGGQVGALNFARHAYGGQIGFINLSDTLSGGAVGLLTISLKGYHRVDLTSGDVMPLSLHIRTGTRTFHNILGYSPAVTPDERWGFLYGFGFEPRVWKLGFFNIDLTAEQIVEQRVWVDAVNILGRLSVSYGVMVDERFTLSAGPVLNTLFSDWRDPETGAYLTALPPDQPPMQWFSGWTVISGWYGWKAAVGVRF